MDELDEIRRDTRTAQLLREGTPGSGIEQERARIRLNGGNPAAGEALRAQQPMRIDARLAAPQVAPPVQAPVYTAGPDGVSTQAPAERTLREKVNYSNPQMDADKNSVRERLSSAKPATSPAVPPRNVPLDTSKSYRAGQAVGKVARIAGPAAAGASVIGGMGTYQLDDPGVDSSAAGTIRAVANGDYAGAARSAGKGALEAGMDLGGSVAGVIDSVIPGGQPVTDAYQGALKKQFGGQLKIGDPAALRAAVGLGERVTLTPDAPRRVAAGETRGAPAKPAPATTVQRPSNGGSTGVNTGSGPRTIAETAQAQPQYTLGENAVEIIRPGGDRTVETFGPNGNEGAVPSEIFNVGQTAQWRAAQAKAMQEDMLDPKREIAKERVQNEGRMAERALANKGALDVANVRQEERPPKPELIKDISGNVTSAASWRAKPGGGWEPDIQPVAGAMPKPKMANDKLRKEALAKVQAGANIEEVNARLRGWGIEPLVMDKK